MTSTKVSQPDAFFPSPLSFPHSTPPIATVSNPSLFLTSFELFSGVENDIHAGCDNLAKTSRLHHN